MLSTRMRHRHGRRRTKMVFLMSFFYSCVAIALVTAASVTATAPSSGGQDSFREKLTIRPLADGRVHAFFSFVLSSPVNVNGGNSLPTYAFVPRSLVHVADGSNADEVHLAINAGRWDYTKWGIPFEEQMVGTGAEVRALIRSLPSETNQSLNSALPGSIAPHTLANWRKLTADLAGLFCASLDALDEKLTVIPFDQRKERGNHHQTEELQAILSSESICTENLSTLLKLLPCKSMAGLAVLLKPHQFFLADFHGIALHLTRSKTSWNVTINVQAVFSPALAPGVRLKRDWSFEKLFGTRMKQSCPLVDSSSVTVLAPPRQKSGNAEDDVPQAEHRVWPIVMHPAETKDIDENDDLSDTDKLLKKAERFALNLDKQGFYTFDTRRSSDLNVEMQWPNEGAFAYPSTYSEQKVTASRILSGYGQERGTVELTIRNNDATQTRNVIYHEVLPWFMKPFLHTLKASVTPDEYDEDTDNVVRFADDVNEPVIRQLNYTPSVPRARPFHLQARLRIAPQSTVHVAFEYEKAFMRFAEHPPDAHRGFDVAPATVELEDGSMLYTEPALVEVAVPDFSMPYNVIIFTSTLIALCAGSTLNNMIRKYVDMVESEPALAL